MSRDGHLPDGLDHVIVGVPDLDEGVAWFESCSGVAPQNGGNHPGLGTHNAIVGLGSGVYLELLAVDPNNPQVNPTTEWLARVRRPTPFGWAVKTADAGGLEARLARAKVPSQHLRLERATPDGGSVAWEVVLVPHELGPLVPFFIDWATAAHPAADAPDGCHLVALSLQHPDPEPLRAALASIGVAADVDRGSPQGLRIRVATPMGELDLTP